MIIYYNIEKRLLILTLYFKIYTVYCILNICIVYPNNVEHNN